MYDVVLGVLIAFILICLVILFCVILVKIYISKIKKYNYLLVQQEVEQERAITETIIETQEDTLSLLSKELHDDAGQQITYINFQLENLKLTNPELIDNILPIGQSLSYLSKSIRDLSHSIDNKKFSNYNVLELIREELDKTNLLKLVDCSLEHPEDIPIKLTINENIILFRIFQEVLNNMLKHSKAKQFSVKIEQTHILKFIFKDNGVGFEVDQISEATSGVANIKNRAELIGYTLQLDSEIDKGTVIELYKKE